MKRLVVGAVMVFITAVAISSAQAQCKSVNGHITSELVEVFSNGAQCPSPISLCTEGRFIGGLKGEFTFVAQTLNPTGAVPDVAFTIGEIQLSSNQCDGTLILTDTSAFSLSPDGQFGGLQTVDGDASTGDCNEASGRLRVFGVFIGGCVDCTYRGEICINDD